MVGAFIDDERGLRFETPGVWMLDDEPHLSKCRSCEAPIVWAKNADSGKRAPFDPIADDAPFDGSVVSQNHFVTCPQASLWRKKSPVDLHVNRSEPLEERG